MELSLKVPPTQVRELNANPTGAAPSKGNCLQQISVVHELDNSERNFDAHQFDLDMRIMRNHVGLGPPLRHCMDLHAARQINRLPFLTSSNLMEDVLLGRDEMISFSDFLGIPENYERLRQPHIVTERALGIL